MAGWLLLPTSGGLKTGHRGLVSGLDSQADLSAWPRPLRLGAEAVPYPDGVSLFQAVRIFSAVESVIFAALLVVAFGHVDEHAATVLGWTHGLGFLGLFALIYVACVRGAVPWPVLASAVLLTPWGSSVHIELLRRRRVRSSSSSSSSARVVPRA